MVALDPAAVLRAAANPVLTPTGFRGKRLTWHRGEQSSVLIVNFQRSPFSRLYYLNLAVYFRALGTEATPPAHRAHVQIRHEQLDKDFVEAGALDFDRDLSQADRATAIQQSLRAVALPWLLDFVTFEGAQRRLESSPPLLVFKGVRELLATPVN